MRKVFLLLLILLCGCSAGEPRLPVQYRRPAQKMMKKRITKVLVRTYFEGQADYMKFITQRYDANGCEAIEKLIENWRKDDGKWRTDEGG